MTKEEDLARTECAEAARMDMEWLAGRHVTEVLLAEIDRLRHALYCIKVEYAYCTQCSASALAEQALEQKP